MRILFLGTGTAFPTPERNHSGTYIDIGPEALLFDCGEGTQRQMAAAKISPAKIQKIFITHWHGDHVLGLAGLLQSMQMSNRPHELHIYGPEETRHRFELMRKAFGIGLSFKYIITEIKATTKPKKIIDEFDYEIWAVKTIHPIPCLAFKYVKKPLRRINIGYVEKFGIRTPNPILRKLADGKNIKWEGKLIRVKDATYIKPGIKISYIIDSAYSKHLSTFAKESDILICESTFGAELQDAAALKGHMTTKDAAMIANEAKVKELIITHISQRYKDPSILLKEAKSVFANTKIAHDLMEIKF